MPQNVAVIGAGLVGCLMANYLSKLGFSVTVFEYRKDMRKEKVARGRSINLALSNRGLRALETCGIPEEALTSSMVAMKGRVIHQIGGKLTNLPYDVKHGRCIFSIGRDKLNILLLNEICEIPDIKVNFQHKVLGTNFATGSVAYSRLEDNEHGEEKFDLIVGCDGAYSVVRRNMLKIPLFDYSQTYIDHGYMELSIPANRGNSMSRNYLHIWPRLDFMMIALPNEDGSWTVTLFMPFQYFRNIRTSQQLAEFFQNHFPDALQLIGLAELTETFFTSKPQPLISVKCNKYNVGGKAVIIGDAAHAVVPFYGQGMNAGFEDCLILFETLKKRDNNLVAGLEEFSKIRVPDGNAISDLSMYNYLEMRNLVLAFRFRTKKALDNFLYKNFGNIWTPLYVAVTFSNAPYSACFVKEKFQNRVISGFFCLAIAILGFMIYAFYGLR